MEIANKRSTPSFFLFMAITGLLAAIIGFGKTFFLPVATGNFKAPPIVHVHGAFAFAWVTLFVIQPLLIHFKKYSIHGYLGIAGVFIAAGILVTMVPVGCFVVNRDLLQGMGEASYSSLLGVITSGLLFFSLVLAAVFNRTRPEYHKRLMLLATIVVLWPAWFRFRHYFPSVPRPEIWFALVLADSLIVVAWIWDKMKNGRIHPVLKYGGPLIILEQTFEVIAFDSVVWRSIGKWLYNFI